MTVFLLICVLASFLPPIHHELLALLPVFPLLRELPKRRGHHVLVPLPLPQLLQKR